MACQLGGLGGVRGIKVLCPRLFLSAVSPTLPRLFLPFEAARALGDLAVDDAMTHLLLGMVVRRFGIGLAELSDNGIFGRHSGGYANLDDQRTTSS